MKTVVKKFLSVLMAFAMLVGVIPLSAMAEGIPAEEIRITFGDTLAAEPNSLYALRAEFLPEGAQSETVTWTSSDSEVAHIKQGNTVSDSTMTLLKPGTAVITATSANGLIDTCTVVVSDYPDIALGERKVLTTSYTTAPTLRFVPKVSGTYIFRSLDSTSGIYGFLCDKDMEIICSDDLDPGDNFKLSYDLTAEETYCIQTLSLGEEGSPYTVTVEKTTITTAIEIAQGDAIRIYEGQQMDLSVNYYPENAGGEAIAWTSDDSSVATVDADGHLLGRKPGTITITATTDAGLSDTCEVEVLEAPTLVLGEEVVFTSTEEAPHAYYKLLPAESGTYIFEMDGPNVPFIYILDAEWNYVYWKRGESASCQLEADALYYIEFKPVEAGSHTLLVNKEVPATAIEITNNPTAAYIFDTAQLSCHFQSPYAKREFVTWTSNNKDVAKVDDNGYVEFLSPGTVTITVTAENGLTDSCTIEVIGATPIICDEVKELSTSEDQGYGFFSFVPEESGTYAFVSQGNSCDPYVTLYDDGMKYIAEADDDGDNDNFYLQYDLEAGKTYYLKTETYFSHVIGIYTVKMIKKVPATSMEIIGLDYLYYMPGESERLRVSFGPENAIIEEITWTSDNEDVVIVDKDGRLDCLVPGTATITVTSENGLVASCTVTVQSRLVLALGQPTQVTLTEDRPQVEVYFTPEEDGYYAFYSAGEGNDPYANLYDGDDHVVDDDDSGEELNFRMVAHLLAGETYWLQIGIYSDDATFPVYVEKVPSITKMEIVSMPDKTSYYQGTVEENLDYDGMLIRLTWSNGHTDEWSEEGDWYFGEYELGIDSSMADEIGEVIFYCGEASVTLKLTLLENPVDHIELISGTEDYYIENYGGYIDENDDGECFYYNTYYPHDAEIKIVYKDGTSKTAHVGDEVDEYRIEWDDCQYDTPWVVGTNNVSIVSYLGHTVVLPITVKQNPVKSIEVISNSISLRENIDGYFDSWYDDELEEGIECFIYEYDLPDDMQVKINYLDGTSKTAYIGDKVDEYGIDCNDSQYDIPWTLGGDNHIEISYLGVTTTISVVITESPVDHIEINTPPTREYTYGDVGYGTFYNNGDYDLHPTDLTGLSFTVYFKDGTPKAYTYKDMDKETFSIDGFPCELAYDLYNPTPGNLPVTFRYMGHSVNYAVSMKASPVASIAVTKDPVVTVCPVWNIADLTGMEITITYTDGTSKVVTLTEDNMAYQFPFGSFNYNPYTMFVNVTVDGYILRINNNHHYGDVIYLHYLGAVCQYSGITGAEEPDISKVEILGSAALDKGVTAKITYADQTTETVTWKALLVKKYESGGARPLFYVLAESENGLMIYEYQAYHDEEDDTEKYSVMIYGKSVRTDTPVNGPVHVSGDADGNEEVTANDALLTLQVATGKVQTSEAQTVAADVDGNGTVTATDALLILQYATKKILAFPVES